MTVLLDPTDLNRGLAADALRGLASPPRWLPPKYFYDDRGSELFEQITDLPEYYPTRTERAVLSDHASDIVRAAGADILLELGSGSSDKTTMLLDAMQAQDLLRGYVPVDVSPAALAGAVQALAITYPGLTVAPVVADFERHLAELPVPGRRLVAFLGSTIGNFTPDQRRVFLSDLAATLQPGESVLVGLDLVKDPARLVAAYDDSAGVTAEFNRNVLHVLNRELGADFDPSAFTHVARWDSENEWMEMRLRAQRPMRVTLDSIDLSIDLANGEEIRTEISSKFRRAGIERELSGAGLTPTGWWTDSAHDYALVLASREGASDD